VLPFAHVVHQLLWILYAVPVLIVLASIVKTTLAQRRARREEEPG
jgi:cytochrome c-type biogenesis protein CcmH/NrfF